jgi:hypothetical protein
MYYADLDDNNPIWYRYKLNENSDSESQFLNTIFVYKQSRDYTKPVKELEPFIRTKENPKGVVDFQEFEKTSRKILNDSEQNYYDVLPIGSKEFYSTLSRKELYKYCAHYNLDTVNNSTKFLIDKIIDKQHLYAKINDELGIGKNFMPEETLIDTLINAEADGETIIENPVS